jgi:hypothetical protein
MTARTLPHIGRPGDVETTEAGTRIVIERCACIHQIVARHVLTTHEERCL